VHPEAAGGARLFRPDGHEAPRHAGERQAALPLPGDAVAAPRGAAAAGPVNGDQRRRRHDSLGNGGHRNGNGSGSGVHGNGAAPAHHQPNGTHSNAAAAPIAHPNGERYHRERDNSDGAAPLPHGASPIHADRLQPAPDRGRDGALIQRYQPPAEEAPRKEGTRTIDHELRARVDSDIAAFLAAFDAALAQDTQEHRSALREATDRLLRAGARTRIELERLEARVPLPRRDIGGPGEPASRYR
jgi:hypothetical protein